ncbi:MAG TPA: serine/threonine-protein kinase, partial [Planctomycetia bacterium]|nr:serine/threonine-protein kinase [Planctomycetia bacterium]
AQGAAAVLGTIIAGRYTLAEVIGEGGMGSVYLARQTEPVKRQVALKLIRTGMDSAAVNRRFEAERQALAVMDHPNIARIYDGGLTPTGQPFFVMELVPGVPITRYCDERRLDIRARLALFVTTCQAVQHAHQKGIIHRDLKPANVLVAEVDGRPVPKVIDFGVAKATEQKLTDTSIADLGLIIGTPAYMSPEQADPSSADVDTRTDVYALGVILYELLTGAPPFDVRRFRRGAILEMLRMVREEEPPRPSTKLSTSEALPSVAANRSIEPAKLSRSLRGDLDVVVMKALEKDRARRYETAAAFARDVERYLADEVVEARPPSAAYRLSKFLRRNKATVTATGLVVLAIIGGMVGTTLGMVRAKAAETLAKERLEDVVKERDLKEAARKDAVAIVDFLSSVFKSPSPHRDGRTITMAENLDAAAKRLDEDLAAQPAERANLRASLAVSYRALGLPHQAIPLEQRVLEYYRGALGPEDPKTLRAMNNLIMAYYSADRREEGMKLADESLTLRRKVDGPEHEDTIRAMIHLAAFKLASGRAAEALALRQEALALSKKVIGPEHEDTITATSDLSLSFHAAGKFDESLKLQEEVVALRRKTLGPEHLDTFRGLYNLAATLADLGRKEEALKLLEEVLAQFRKRLGPDHHDTLIALQRLATVYDAIGRQEDALKLREETLAVRLRTSGPEHTSTLMAMGNLAASYLAAFRREEALKLQEEVLRQRRKLSGPDHPETLVAINNLAVTYSELGRAAEALALREKELVPGKRKLFGAEHPETIVAMFVLALSYNESGRFPEGAALLKQALQVGRKRLPQGHLITGQILSMLGYAELKAGSPTDAEPHLREALAILEKTGPKTLFLPFCRSDLAAVLLRRKEYPEAEKLLLASFAALKQRQQSLPPGRRFRLLQAADLLIDLYTATNKPVDAAKWRAERAELGQSVPKQVEK